MAPIDEFSRLVNDERVTVVVGPDDASRTFNIPRALLCTEPWFDAAFKRDTFREGTEGKVFLPEDDPEAFEVFQYWLFNKILFFEHLTSKNDYETDLVAELHRCMKAWIFGDKYGIIGLQNAVMLRACDILSAKKVQMSWDSVATCYTAQHPQLRKLAAEAIAYLCQTDISAISAYQSLFTTDGLVADILGAQLAAGQAPKDLPRYRKPNKFRSLFYVETLKVT